MVNAIAVSYTHYDAAPFYMTVGILGPMLVFTTVRLMSWDQDPGKLSSGPEAAIQEDAPDRHSGQSCRRRLYQLVPQPRPVWRSLRAWACRPVHRDHGHRLHLLPDASAPGGAHGHVYRDRSLPRPLHAAGRGCLRRNCDEHLPGLPGRAAGAFQQLPWLLQTYRFTVRTGRKAEGNGAAECRKRTACANRCTDRPSQSAIFLQQAR